MRNRLPSDRELLELVEEGLTDRDIAEMYGVTVQAVNKRLRKLGVNRRSQGMLRTNALINHRWTVYVSTDADSHHHAYPSKMLRLWLRLQLGDKTVKPEDARMAAAWARELRDRGEVLCYDRVKGWFYRPRRLTDGKRAIDWPAGLKYHDQGALDALDLPPKEQPD